MNGLQRKMIPSSHLMLFGLKMMSYLMLMSLELCHQKEKIFKHHCSTLFLQASKENMMTLQVLKN